MSDKIDLIIGLAVVVFGVISWLVKAFSNEEDGEDSLGKALMRQLQKHINKERTTPPVRTPQSSHYDYSQERIPTRQVRESYKRETSYSDENFYNMEVDTQNVTNLSTQKSPESFPQYVATQGVCDCIEVEELEEDNTLDIDYAQFIRENGKAAIIISEIILPANSKMRN